MKNRITFLFALIGITLHSQDFNKFPYSGYIQGIENPQNIRVLIELENETSTVLYSENHQILTRDNGYFYLVIGSGENQINNISDLPWGTENIYINSTFFSDEYPNGNDLGRSKVFSVPYSNTSLRLVGDQNKEKTEEQVLKIYNSTIEYVGFESTINAVTVESSSNVYTINSWSRSNENIRLFTSSTHLNVGDKIYLRDVNVDSYLSEVVEVHDNGYTCLTIDEGDSSGNEGVFSPSFNLVIGEAQGLSSIRVLSPNDQSIILNSLRIVNTNFSRTLPIKLYPPTVGVNTFGYNKSYYYPMLKANGFSPNGFVGNFSTSNISPSYGSDPFYFNINGLNGGSEYISISIMF